MNRALFVSALVGVLPFLASLPARALTIDTVPIGNPGNPAGPGGRGDVAYAYQISTYEVTNSQFAEFLNAKAASDPLGLYNSQMSSDPRGGIVRTGVDGAYSYATLTNMGNKPVNFVSPYDTLRFANWLHNGQGNGDTETGSYLLGGGTPVPNPAVGIVRQASATWVLPTLDEWTKAAYYQPAESGGDVDGYWQYATASNTSPALAAADTFGNISNPGANVANRLLGADWNGQDGNVTTVGSAGAASSSFYGTFDQTGSIAEWNESQAVIQGNPFFGYQGASWKSGIGAVNEVGIQIATNELDDLGFRVALVPEPQTFVTALLGLLSLMLLKENDVPSVLSDLRGKSPPLPPTIRSHPIQN